MAGTELQKAAKKAGDEAAAKVKASGGDKVAQDAAARKAIQEVEDGAAQAVRDASRQTDPPSMPARPPASVAGATDQNNDGRDDAADDDRIQRLPPDARANDMGTLTPEDEAELREAERLDAERLKNRTAMPTVGSAKRPIIPASKGPSNPAAVSLLLDACEVFGINPFADQKPVELLSWASYPGADDAAQVTPDAVVIVTAGGVKLKHYDDPSYPMDPETKERLERIHGANRIDPRTRLPITVPLGDDVTLPATAVTGRSNSTEHQYVGGYLKGGGRVAADQKAARRDERMKRHGLA